ncbi:MAG: alpha-amylase family glycosyl hydrolase, partial [Pseudomonadota bacterium]
LATALATSASALTAPMKAPDPAPYQTGGTCVEDDPAGKSEWLHVPSPAWEKQIIYSVQLDRFNDGDPSRNELGQGEYDPERQDSYSGGDIRGLIDKLDYLQSLGVTTILLSPIIANKWRDPGLGEFVPYTGYHGYWPVGFRDLDAHLGGMEDLRRLSAEVHQRGMFLIMDAVINHTAHYYHYTGPYDPADVTKNFDTLEGQLPPKPLDPPFDQNDVRSSNDKAADIYNWTPPITDFNDPEQMERYQLELVNDLNTRNPQVREALKSAYSCWLKQIGFDGVRFDAAKHVEREFWADFLDGPNGLKEVAREVGRDDLLTYGEVWQISPPFDDNAEELIASFMTDDERSGVGTAMGYPLFSSINKVINVGKRTDILGYRLETQMRAYPDPFRIINFLDNHDTVRFSSQGDTDGYHQALAILLTVPGIPFLYQGSEQGLSETRQAMFAGGYLSEKSQFDTQSDVFNTVAALAQLRTTNGDLFASGSFKLLATNPVGPGIFAFERKAGDQTAFVLINTADKPTLANNLPTGLAPGTRLRVAHASHFGSRDMTVGQNQSLTFVLPAKAIAILISNDADPELDLPQPLSIKIDAAPGGAPLTSDQLITGSVSVPGTPLKLILDSNYDAALPFNADENGAFRVMLPVNDMGGARHFFEVASADGSAASAPIAFVADRTAERAASIKDPLGDTDGLDGGLQKPLHPSIGEQMDIAGVEGQVAGNQLLVRLTMAEVTDEWSYPNGFENVAFHISIDDREVNSGQSPLPFINAAAPQGFDWDVTNVLHGFVNTSYRNRSGEAEELADGAPRIKVGKDTITLRYDCSGLGIDCAHPISIHISTWDRDLDGELRPLSTEAGLWEFGGGKAETPYILDQAQIDIP